MHAEYQAGFLIELAGRRFLLQGIPPGWEQSLPPRLQNCRVQSNGVTDRMINVEMSDHASLYPQAGSRDLNEASLMAFEQGQVSIKSDWYEAKFGVSADSDVHIEVHVDSRPWFGGVIENLLRRLVAYEVLSLGGVMLHSAAIVKDQRAAVLFGHSGAGKSTTSTLALANGCQVISDDINIIEPAKRGWQVTPVPFSGTLTAVSKITQPVTLQAIFRLQRADRDEVIPCSNARAISLLAGSAPFVNQDPLRMDQLLDVLAGLCAAIPIQDLYFTRSDKFLQHLFQTIA